MAEIDGSIIGNIGRQSSPLQFAGEAAGVINALNQNKLFQARQAAGQALQGAVGPNGQVDENALMRAVAADPRAALAAGETATQSLGRQVQQVTIDGQQLDQHLKQLGAERNALTALLANPNAGPKDAAQSLGELVAAGVMKPEQALSFAQTIPSDPAEFKSFLTRHMIGNMDQEKQLSLIGMGQPQLFNVGDHAVEVRLSRNPAIPSTMGPQGEAIPQGGLPMTMSPAEKAERVPFVGPNNQPQTISKGEIATPEGMPKASGVTGPGGTLNAGLRPGVAEAAQASSQQYADDLKAAGSAQTQMVPLRKVYDLLPTTNTGPGTQVTNGWRSFLHSQLPMLDKIIPGFDQRKIDTANADELKKYMVQIASASAAQFGAGTNEKLAVAASGNPNPDMSNLAARDVVRMNIALLRAQQARMAAFEETGGDPQDYAKFSAKWARQVDPRAFMLDLLSKQERQKVLSGINTDAEKRAFLAGKRAAEETGLFSEDDIPR